MATSSHPVSPAAPRPASRWARAQAGEADALRELAASYWYVVYAWWRRSGSEDAIGLTQACFKRWLNTAPPDPSQPEAARLREWLLAQLRALAAEGLKPIVEPSSKIDAEWAAQRYADEPPGAEDELFQRRWALTVLEFAMDALCAEYTGRGQVGLFAEVSQYAGFEAGDDDRYTETGRRLGLTAGGARKAVFDFRSRHQELLREVVVDTLADPSDINTELTALLIGCDAAGAGASLPSAIAAFKPDELLARAMRSVRMTSGRPGEWTPPSDEEVARLLPQYEMLGLLGRGGMGAVYKARQISLDRFVAIKLMPLEISVDQEFAERFRREARAMAKLSHPHIISVYDFGQTAEGHLYFVMEFIEGAMLHALIHAGKGTPNEMSLPPDIVLELIQQVCDALAYAHEHGVVHRDIKPANVMVDTRGQVKVADFGLARVAEAEPGRWGDTMTGVVLGTADYMAPEQKRGAHVDHRADIYSLGVMLYEGLCQQTPQGVFQMPSKRCGLDKRLDAIISRAMADQPDARYQSTKELKSAIEVVRPSVARAQAKKAKPLVPATARVPANTSAAKTVLPRKVLVAVLGVIGLAGVIALVTSCPARKPAKAGGTTPRIITPPATPGQASFVNSLGMKFLPVPITGGPTKGRRILFSIWETRVQDYEVFATETGREWRKPTFVQGPTHPAVDLNREDAQAFCTWLTDRERKAGKLSAHERYRLPSDYEWSCAVGLPESPDVLPELRNSKIVGIFPWEGAWPPPAGAGNYAGEEVVGHPSLPPSQPCIAGYRDDFPTTAPAGSFAANRLGLFDLGGNAEEWVEDVLPNDPLGRVTGITRGGSFGTNGQGYATSGYRGHPPAVRGGPDSGFRVVLGPVDEAPPASAPKESTPEPP